jgi:alpha-galactosidase
VSEQQGEVLMGTLGWTGNFRFTFEVDNVGNLRVIPGINPYASAYELKAGEVFTTPEFIFTLSQKGASVGSRRLHEWARNYSLKDGHENRLTLLNNWENTGFDFNQEKLAELMKEAKHLGVDLFLLDDGWFGNKYPRKDDHAGLGDWEVTHDKLPGGVPALVQAAKEADVKFGIWIEPEMVNPQSELFEQHPNWAIRLPNRDTYYYRNQLVLDLSNPRVQDYVYSIVDNLMKENPDIAFFKWDCNSPITNIYSPYLKTRQGQLYVDHIRGVYNVMRRVKENYPHVPMMLCSGGGARCDYEALKYFTEFWCSDNTDPVERVYIQWGFSQFFPAKAMCAHVTSWNKQTSVKFRTDVASMCKLGFDLGLKELSADELAYCQEAVANWKRLQPVTMDGDQYRLISPYDTNHMAVNYVNKDRTQAVLFAYDIHPRFQEKLRAVKLQGLDPDKQYRVKEINLMPGTESALAANGRTFSGDYLMKVGLNVLTANATTSHVVELTAE